MYVQILPSNVTIAKQVLRSRGLDYPSYFYWISLASLFGFSFLFNVGFGLALTYLRGLYFLYIIISSFMI